MRPEESTNRRRWWHYTLGRTVIMVIADGVIRRADRFVGKGERKAVWFSAFAARVQSALRDHPVDLGTRAGG